nr:MAG TPA: hypothetical protein [Caudoviricetes sp.]
MFCFFIFSFHKKSSLSNIFNKHLKERNIYIIIQM